MTQFAHKRSGATLVEVLVAMMIMGIGLVSVAALFPLSIIRSVQANLLTNGTALRYNAQGFLNTVPSVYPSASFPLFAPQEASLLLADPDFGDLNGNSNPFDDQAFPVLPSVTTNFMVDPLGIQAGLPNTVGTSGNFRYDAGFNAANPAFGGSLPAAIASAQSLFTLPDSWNNRFEAMASAATATSATLTGLGAANINGTSTTINVRAVIFNSDGSQSQTRLVAAIPPATNLGNPGDTITWIGALPANFGQVGNVRIESQELRYSWLLTAQQAAFTAPTVRISQAFIAVFFKRPFGEAAENTTYNCVFTTGNKTVPVMWPSSGASPQPDPYLKKGSYVLDPFNMAWYRIQNFTDIVENDSTTPHQRSTTLTLEEPCAGPASPSNFAIFMRGIVDVYNLGPVSSTPQ